jgi:hypothetical protein
VFFLEGEVYVEKKEMGRGIKLKNACCILLIILSTFHLKE